MTLSQCSKRCDGVGVVSVVIPPSGSPRKPPGGGATSRGGGEEEDGEGRRLSRQRVRELWKKAILETLLLISMEKENNSIQGVWSRWREGEGQRREGRGGVKGIDRHGLSQDAEKKVLLDTNC